MVRVGVRQNHGIHVLGPDAGHLQPRHNRAGGARDVRPPGIHQHHVPAGLDQQAGIRAEDCFPGLPALSRARASDSRAGVREEP